MNQDLFTPLRIGALELPNRIVMAPLTRCRATMEGCVVEMTARYYAARAEAGLLISEATQICAEGQGYPFTPGIYTDAHVKAWRAVTDRVHDSGGRIFCQLWHVGRVSHREFQPGGALPVSSSSIAPKGTSRTYTGSHPYEAPRALEESEIPGVIERYRHAAQCAKTAGFDGVELHGANGYLPDQFLRDGTNTRADAWGGTLEKRARFMLESMKALIGVWGADRVGVRLSPSGTSQTMRDSDPESTFGYVVRELDKMKPAYLHIMEALEGDVRHAREVGDWKLIPVSFFRAMCSAPIITNSGFTKEKADTYISRGDCDAVAFGVPFISNPDLVNKFRTGMTLRPPDPSTFYAGGERGYTVFD
ncbi:MAG: alkene reductase [Phycisphaerales bacterium]|jgi:N-ethylmaleimide reductase